MKKLLSLFLILFLTSSCSLYDIKTPDIPKQFYPPKESTDEVAYLETVSRPHETIGTVMVNAERARKMEYILEKLKYEAAMIGADAITNITTNDGEGRWARIKPKLLENANIRANYIADAVVFK